MSWTGANERTVKNWLAGVSGPSGEHLVELVRQSDAVAEAFLILAGRRDIVDAKRLMNAHGGLAQMLAMVDTLRVERAARLDGSARDLVTIPPAQSAAVPTNDLVRDPANVPEGDLQNRRLNTRQLWFLQQLMSGQLVRAIDLRRRWAVSEKTAKRDIALLKKQGLIEFVGAFKTGNYRCVVR